MTEEAHDHVDYCPQHIEQVSTLTALKTRMTMLIALTGGIGSLGIGILMSINASANTLAVNIASLTGEVKAISARVAVMEDRLSNCEREVDSLRHGRAK